MLKKDLPFLTSIRFLAAFWVFIFHINLRWPLEVPNFFKHIIEQGAIGMSLFFILSGFILTYNYYDKDPINNYKDFIIKRLARIYPVYALAGLLLITLMPITGSIIAKLLLVGLDITMLQAWLPQTFFQWNNASSWSLSNEFFFYLAFPFLLSGLHKSNNKQKILIAIIAYAGCVLPGIVGQTVEPHADFTTVYSLPIYRLFEFIIGMLFGFLFEQRPDGLGKFNYAAVLLLIGLVFWELATFGNMLQFYVGHNFLVVPAFGLIIYLSATWNFKWLNYPLNFLGQSSYSFYLLQSLPIMLFTKNQQFLTNSFPALQSPWAIFAICFFSTQVLASICYLGFETPIRKIIVNKFTKPQNLLPCKKLTP